ncbi:YcaO-like family protein [Nocardiopsis suaedae]|uniref:YcaO-like family protein n=1 Tax=Nocardiopsis suaedae TaxID=3018444 RepID=A0ABT4TIY8_9ACTN|nr:YcaO-like family protein [Nocardiopsis suaedae]MDA2804669.1 YcaO-like family protein [Nocardiopsis suaedae]
MPVLVTVPLPAYDASVADRYRAVVADVFGGEPPLAGGRSHVVRTWERADGGECARLVLDPARADPGAVREAAERHGFEPEVREIPADGAPSPLWNAGFDGSSFGAVSAGLFEEAAPLLGRLAASAREGVEHSYRLALRLMAEHQRAALLRSEQTGLEGFAFGDLVSARLLSFRSHYEGIAARAKDRDALERRYAAYYAAFGGYARECARAAARAPSAAEAGPPVPGAEDAVGAWAAAVAETTPRLRGEFRAGRIVSTAQTLEDVNRDRDVPLAPTGFHAFGQDSASFQDLMHRNPDFLAFRLQASMLYSALHTLGFGLIERYLFCYLLARANEEVAGRSARDLQEVLGSVADAFAARRGVPLEGAEGSEGAAHGGYTEHTPEGLRRIKALLSPYGLVSRTAPLPVADGEPRFELHAASLGDPSKALRNLRGWSHGADMGNMNGVGGALTAERARAVAIAESLERYSTCAWDEDALVVASEKELERQGEEFASPSRWPRCSEREAARPECGVVPYDPALPIRWVRGWSLTRRCEVLVPAAAVYMHMPERSRSERFMKSVTTGAAVHSDPRSAVLNGLLEVVERDAIALVWLQRLSLPELSVDPARLDPAARAYHDRGSSTGLTVRLFDATTDFGIPVVYGVQLSDSDPVLGQIVCATCDMDPRNALAKLHRELAALRVALRGFAAENPVERPDPGKVSVVGSALYNAAPSRRGAFGFLLESGRGTRPLEALPRPAPEDDPLAAAVDRVAAAGAEALAVDITTDEARQVGMHAVKVVVPEAVPLSFVHAERYLATERLYTAPTAMGFAAGGEDSLNPDPQPFA